MWQKFFSDLIINGAQKVFTAVIGAIADGMRTKRYNQLNARLDQLEVELRHKPRISKDEAMDIARSINDIRSGM